MRVGADPRDWVEVWGGLQVECGAAKMIQGQRGGPAPTQSTLPLLSRQSRILRAPQSAALCTKAALAQARCLSGHTEVTLSVSLSSTDGARWPRSRVWRCGSRATGFAIGLWRQRLSAELRHFLSTHDKEDRASKTWFQVSLYHQVAVCPWKSCPGLGFLICQLRRVGWCFRSPLPPFCTLLGPQS